MKTIIFALCVLISVKLLSQDNNALLELSNGIIAVMPDVPKALYSTYNIRVVNNKTEEMTYSAVNIYSEKKDATTILFYTKGEECYLVGYSPVIKNGVFTGVGQFVLLQKMKNEISTVYNQKVTLRGTWENGHEVEYLEIKSDGIAIMIRDKFEVGFMKLGSFTFLLPENYFNYK